MFESKGLKRTLGLIFLIAGQAFENVPQLLPYKWVLDSVGLVLGSLGLGHAAVAGTLTGVKK